MPDITSYNGIDMADIASINGQDIASGGAFNPVTGAGTYTETIPSTGLIKRGGQNLNSANYADEGRTTNNENSLGYVMGTDAEVNVQSDVDGVFVIVEDTLPAGMGTPTKVVYGKYSSWIIDNAGKLWRVASSTLYGGNASGSGTNVDRRTWSQVTGVGDSDTGWTAVATSETSALCINSGKLYGIGSNSYGAFGRGNTSSQYNSFSQIGSDSDWVSVNMTKYNSQAIKGSSNALYTAGRNHEGQNGNGTKSGYQLTFTAVDATNMVSATNNNVTLVRGNQNVIGFLQSGRAFAMGKSGSNENMGGNINSDQTVAVQIGKVGGTLQTDWADISISDNFSQLINTSGHLYFAGDGNYYVTLDGTTNDEVNDNHRRIGTDTDWQGLAVMSSYSFQSASIARKNNQLVYAGYDKYGRIGGTNSNYVITPTVVSSGTVSSNGVWGIGENMGGWQTGYVYYYST
jgi:hypothetical protein